MNRWKLRLPMVAIMSLLAGCAAVSRRDGALEVREMLHARIASAEAWPQDPAATAAIDRRVEELLSAPLDAEVACRIAQLRNPRMAEEYARLGIAQADVVAASRIGNPGFSGSALKADGLSKITTGFTLPLTDLLMLPARRKLASGGYEREQRRIAANLLALTVDVREAWYQAAGAEQVAAMRKAIADAAAASADLAARYHAAGNISELELGLEQAGAAQARIAATAARAESTRARLALNALMGLAGEAASRWRLDVPMAAPVDGEDDLETLLSLAREDRLDLAAAERQVAILGDAVEVARRWRLLGRIDIGVEREREGGDRLSGPTLSLAIPLFDQGQAAIARAEGELELSRAELDRLRVQIDNEVRLGHERVAAMRSIAADYRDVLVPAREKIVQGQSERNNFMLIGPFELLLAKQQEFDAYQAYLESVRDYWLARTALSRAIGTRLPSDASAGDRTLGIDAILAPAINPGTQSKHPMGPGKPMDHSEHGAHGTPADPKATPPSQPAADKAGEHEEPVHDHGEPS